MDKSHLAMRISHLTTNESLDFLREELNRKENKATPQPLELMETIHTDLGSWQVTCVRPQRGQRSVKPGMLLPDPNFFLADGLQLRTEISSAEAELEESRKSTSSSSVVMREPLPKHQLPPILFLRRHYELLLSKSWMQEFGTKWAIKLQEEGGDDATDLTEFLRIKLTDSSIKFHISSRLFPLKKSQVLHVVLTVESIAAVLKDRDPNQHVSMKCHSAALMLRHDDTALKAVLSSPTTSDRETDAIFSLSGGSSKSQLGPCGPSGSSLKFWIENVLRPTDRLVGGPDGVSGALSTVLPFVDPGRTNDLLATPDSYNNLKASLTREVVTVHPEDPSLQGLVDQVRKFLPSLRQCNDTVLSAANTLCLLLDRSWAHDKTDDEIEHDIVTQLRESSTGTLDADDDGCGPNVVSLGAAVTHQCMGSCRYNALAFKFLCDQLGIPCFLVRGTHGYQEGVDAAQDRKKGGDLVRHVWNLVQAGDQLYLADTALKQTGNSDLLSHAWLKPWPQPFYHTTSSANLLQPLPWPQRQRFDPALGTMDPTKATTIPLEDLVDPHEEMTDVEDSWDFQEELGRGATSVVCRATKGAWTCAFKSALRPEDEATLRYEYDLLGALQAKTTDSGAWSLLSDNFPTTIEWVDQSQTPSRSGPPRVGEHQKLRSGFVMEYVPLTLIGFLNMVEQSSEYGEHSATRLSPTQLRQSVLGVLGALCQMHRYGLVHRDVKADNVLVTPARCSTCLQYGGSRLCTEERTESQDGAVGCSLQNVKLTDLADALTVTAVEGTSPAMERGKRPRDTENPATTKNTEKSPPLPFSWVKTLPASGTFPYTAPELDERYRLQPDLEEEESQDSSSSSPWFVSTAADMWSLGILAWSLWTGELPLRPEEGDQGWSAEELRAAYKEHKSRQPTAPFASSVVAAAVASLPPAAPKRRRNGDIVKDLLHAAQSADGDSAPPTTRRGRLLEQQRREAKQEEKKARRVTVRMDPVPVPAPSPPAPAAPPSYEWQTLDLRQKGHGGQALAHVKVPIFPKEGETGDEAPPAWLRQLVKGCLQANPFHRLTAQEALRLALNAER